MNILFFFYGTRICKDTDGNLYSSGNFPKEVWERYLSISDRLTCAMRLSPEILDPKTAENTKHRIDTERIHMILLPDKNTSLRTYLSKKLNRDLYLKLEDAVQNCDAAILRSSNSILIRLLQKYQKPYLIEVVGCTLNALWNHGFYGKLLALPSFLSSRKEIKRAPWVLYVTNKFLQRRYPSNGRCISCSDVLIRKQSDEIFEHRLQRIDTRNKSFIIGTLAAVDVAYKGQQYVIRALAKLKREKKINIKYQLVGG